MTKISAVLVGKHLRSFAINIDREAIVFTCADGEQITLFCTGDCCSATWIEAIDDETVLQDAMVTAVENIEMPDFGNVVSKHSGDNIEYIAYYGLKITTTKGSAVIDYRNDSNGYYGGSLEVQE